MSTVFTVGFQESGYDYRDDPENACEIEVLRLGRPLQASSQVEVHFRFNESEKPRTGKIIVSPPVAQWLALALLNATEGAAEILSSEAEVRDGAIVSRRISAVSPPA